MFDDPEDEDLPINLKFPECATCANRDTSDCGECEAGEFYEEEEPESLVDTMSRLFRR